MKLTLKEKCILLCVALVVAVAATRLSAWATAENRKASHSACIYDPVHRLIEPAFYKLQERPLLTRFLTAIDGILIDLSMIALGAVYAFTGKSSTLIPSLVFFYLVRTIALNIVVFPVPRNYIFADPGVPSFFVDYDKVNDLYMSGHTGCLVIYVLDALQSRRLRLLIFFVPFLLYTISILLLEGIHYTNDILIGAFTALMVNRLLFRNRYAFNLFYLKALATIYAFFNFVYVEIRSKAALFGEDKRAKEVAGLSIISIKHEFSADASNASEHTSLGDAK